MPRTAKTPTKTRKQPPHSPAPSPQHSPKSPRARSPQSIKLQEMVLLWKQGKLNGSLPSFTDQLSRIISYRVRVKLNRVPLDDKNPWGDRKSLERMSELEFWDVFQDCFVDVWNHLPTYDPAKAAVSTFVCQRVDSVMLEAHRQLGKRNKARKKLYDTIDQLRASDQSYRPGFQGEHALEVLHQQDPTFSTLVG